MLPQNGADNSKRSDSIRNSRSTGRGPQIKTLKVGITAARSAALRLQVGAPGTEFFDAETGG
jgi:hypothetical protein